MEKASFKVGGMTCGNCVKHVTKALSKVPGVTDPQVDLAAGTIALTYDPSQVSPATIAEAVTRAGYQTVVS